MLLISGLCFANWREASPVHVNRCLQRSGYLNAVQAIQVMREQYKIFFFFFPFTSCSLFRSCSMGPNLAVLTQANSPLERGKTNKRTLLNIWAWGVCSNSDCITSCLIFIFKGYILERQHGLPAKALVWGSKPLYSLPQTLAALSLWVIPGASWLRLGVRTFWSQPALSMQCSTWLLSQPPVVPLLPWAVISSFWVGFVCFFLVQETLTHRDVAVIQSFWAWCRFILAHPWEMAGDGNLACPSGPKSPAVHGNEHVGPQKSEWKGASCCKASGVLLRAVLVWSRFSPADFHSDPFHFSVSRFLALLYWLPVQALSNPKHTGNFIIFSLGVSHSLLSYIYYIKPFVNLE